METGFGDVLRRLRRDRQFTLAELAARAECARSYLSLMETGKKGPPADALLDRLDRTLDARGELRAAARLARTPPAVREQLDMLRGRSEAAARLAEILEQAADEHRPADDRSRDAPGATGRLGGLDRAFRSGELQRLIAELSPQSAGERRPEGVAGVSGRVAGGASRDLPVEVPLINSVAAGYPREFTDLAYPARVADEYIRTADVRDPDAFAARVVGDSMEPDYREGDVVVFSPARRVASGADCFARIGPRGETTFKRVYFEHDKMGRELVRLQPTNSARPPVVVRKERVLALYAAVSVTRSL